MFFLIRCVFWLSVVFSTIFSQHPVRHVPAAQAREETQASPRDKFSELAQTWVGAALSAVKHSATDRCAGTECLGRSLLSAVYAPRERAQAVPQLSANVPLPPRRPQFAPERSVRVVLEKSAHAEYVHSGAAEEVAVQSAHEH